MPYPAGTYCYLPCPLARLQPGALFTSGATCRKPSISLAGISFFAKVQGQIAVNQWQIVNNLRAESWERCVVVSNGRAVIIPFSARLTCERLRCFPGNQWTWFKGKGKESRFYLFAEGGTLTLYDTLREQASHFDLASYGFGSRIRLEDHLNSSNHVGVPSTARLQPACMTPPIT